MTYKCIFTTKMRGELMRMAKHDLYSPNGTAARRRRAFEAALTGADGEDAAGASSTPSSSSRDPGSYDGAGASGGTATSFAEKRRAMEQDTARTSKRPFDYLHVVADEQQEETSRKRQDLHAAKNDEQRQTHEQDVESAGAEGSEKTKNKSDAPHKNPREKKTRPLTWDGKRVDGDREWDFEKEKDDENWAKLTNKEHLIRSATADAPGFDQHQATCAHRDWAFVRNMLRRKSNMLWSAKSDPYFDRMRSMKPRGYKMNKSG
ncbi:unnamed protein product [Amoebophrya sp. A120]|nr:unnamed protein product [Amoebophrya sp. A120]|eukprot:GSA120T00024657001.1